jgi:hypothetical protein
VDVAQALGFLRASEETKDIILRLFEAGHTPSTAKMLHELNIMDAASDAIELAKMLANTRENPSIRTFINMYETFRYNALSYYLLFSFDIN